MRRKVETICALSSMAGVVVMLIGFWPISGMIPVHSTTSTAEQIAQFYRADPGGIRAGLFLALCGLGGYGPLTAVITRHMLRISPRQATLAAAVLIDKNRTPIFPRWVAYLSLWVAVVFIPTGIITFFKTGPFTYAGLLGFYIPLAVFAVWLVAMPYAVIRAIRAEVDQPDQTPVVSGVR